MKFNIEIPFFPGLYESMLYNSDTAYWAIKEELDYHRDEEFYDDPFERLVHQCLEEDDLDFNFEEYSKVVVAGFVSAWENHAPEIVESVEYTGMVSPRQYNFSTDRIFADVELREDWKDVMRHFMASNYDWLQKRIHDDWTSYDGFMSFMENDIDEWDSHLFDDEDERYISTMLGYMMYKEHEDNRRRGSEELRWELCIEALDDVYAGSYVYITDEGKEKLEERRAQLEEDLREGRLVLPDPDQMKLPFTE